MEHLDELIKTHPETAGIIADEVHGRASLTPEEIIILREEVEATERAAQMASQTESPELK